MFEESFLGSLRNWFDSAFWGTHGSWRGIVGLVLPGTVGNIIVPRFAS